MAFLNRRNRFLLSSFLKHDIKASITVFFVALPLCLGIALASNAPVYAGLIAGIVGGIVVTLFSKSPLSVSGPAAGLTAICATAIKDLGSLEAFFWAVSIAGVFQFLLGLLKLGGFTNFIPSAVIKGMLAAIGLLLVSKQVPLVLGYDKPDFWTNELLNLFNVHHLVQRFANFYHSISAAAVTIALLSAALMIIWKQKIAATITVLPTSFIVVVFGVILSLLLPQFFPALQLKSSQYIQIEGSLLDSIRIPDVSILQHNPGIWRTALLICFVASLESLLSIEAIDKIDPYNRITPQNRELMAQGAGNMVSGLLSGLPVTAVIVRSAANAEAGGKTKMASLTHGLWLLLAVLMAVPVLNAIPYCVLAVILIRTGYNLAKPSMIVAVYKQGREQFLPFIITVIAILFTDLLIGVLIGLAYAIYFLVKHTYRAGFTVREVMHGQLKYYYIDLALNVSFLNKKKIMQLLDQIPAYAIVEINGTNSVYIDRDVLEIFQDFRAKAHAKHIQLTLKAIPEVETIELH